MTGVVSYMIVVTLTRMMHLSAMLPETEEITPGSGDHGEVDDA